MCLRFFALLLGSSLVAAPLSGQPPHQLTFRQAHRIVVLVADHDNIDLSDTHIQVNSMDLSADFAPGFFSFIIIRESTTPGPDQTLRRYAVNRRTGDVWEVTLCTHYDFPELTRMQRDFSGRGSAGPSELAAQGKVLGCSVQPGASPAM
jgi:hypothetical protein